MYAWSNQTCSNKYEGWTKTEQLPPLQNGKPGSVPPYMTKVLTIAMFLHVVGNNKPYRNALLVTFSFICTYIARAPQNKEIYVPVSLRFGDETHSGFNEELHFCYRKLKSTHIKVKKQDAI